VQPLTGEVDLGLDYPRYGIEGMFDQPDTGGTVDTLDEQVYIPLLTQFTDEFLLYLVQVVEGQFLGNFRRRRQAGTLRRALIETLQTGLIDGFTYRLAASTTEMPWFPVYFRNHIGFGGDW
jgi:hypothetical protein